MTEESYRERVRKVIEGHGWMVQYVFPVSDKPQPAFHYTVGLRNFDHPELIVIGLQAEVGHWLLNELGELVRNGRSLHPGDRFDDLLQDGYLIELVDVVSDERFPLNTVRRFYGVEDVPALQVVYQDMQRRFPWDEGYDEAAQPLLGVRTNG